jgi:hypothetical protein
MAALRGVAHDRGGAAVALDVRVLVQRRRQRTTVRRAQRAMAGTGIGRIGLTAVERGTQQVGRGSGEMDEAQQGAQRGRGDVFHFTLLLRDFVPRFLPSLLVEHSHFYTPILLFMQTTHTRLGYKSKPTTLAG